MQKAKDPLPTLPGWLSVREAATLAGRSTSSIRRAIALGALPVHRLQGRILIPLVAWQHFVLTPQPPGTRALCPSPLNDSAEKEQERILVTLTVQRCSGQQETLEQRLRVLAQALPQRFPGSLDCSLRQSTSRPDMVLLLLLWDPCTMPPVEERESMLAALRADLATILNWQTEERYEQHIFLHTL